MSDTTAAAEHLRGMTDEMAALVREEIALIRQEALANVRAAGIDLALVGGAGAAALAALFAGTIAAIDALHGGTPARRTGLPLWLAAGTVAAVGGGTAFALLRVALGDLRQRAAAAHEATKEVTQAAGGVTDEVGSNPASPR